jgi:hypothetical protein
MLVITREKVYQCMTTVQLYERPRSQVETILTVSQIERERERERERVRESERERERERENSPSLFIKNNYKLFNRPEGTRFYGSYTRPVQSVL